MAATGNGDSSDLPRNIGRVRSIVAASGLCAAMTALLAAGPAPAPLPPDASPAGVDAPPPFVADYLIARLRPGIEAAMTPAGQPLLRSTDAAARLDLSRANQTLRAAGVSRITPGLTMTPTDRATATQHRLDRYVRLHLSQGTDIHRAKRTLEILDSVFGSVQFDVTGSLAGGPPNDPEFGQQYGMHNTGQMINGQSGVTDADIDAPEAWGITSGSSGTVIAVLDAGVDEHDDLVGRLVAGWNVHDDTPDTSARCDSHGTHVAGIAAATGDNTIGTAGMHWQAGIMPVVVVSDVCTGNASHAADGMIFAADNGADIISMSLQYYADVDMLHDAVMYARAQGVIVIAAAGNSFDGLAGVAWPAKFDEVIGVAATNNLDQRYSQSNLGPELSVAAPGENVWSLTGTTTYDFKSGTSMATPHVAGLAALMLSLDSALTHNDIQAILECTVDDLGVAGFDTSFGHGRINAHRALMAVQGTYTTPGDTNGDCVVNVTDLLALLGDWGVCPVPPPDCPADFTGDGIVNVEDLLLLLANWT